MTHVRRWWPLAVVLIIAAAVFAFVQTRDPVRGQFEDRVTLPSCGSVLLHQGETLRRDAASSVACLRRGHESGNGAELMVEWPTTEGDPVWTYYRVTSDGSTEAYEDSTQDAFGSREWSFTECGSPSSVLEINC